MRIHPLAYSAHDDPAFVGGTCELDSQRTPEICKKERNALQRRNKSGNDITTAKIFQVEAAHEKEQPHVTGPGSKLYFIIKKNGE